MDRTPSSHPTQPSAEMRYVRAYLGHGEESPALVLYEIDPKGFVHRHVEVTLEGARFAPEDLLLLAPLDADALVIHRGAEEINAQAFDALWNEVETSRRFRADVPDPTASQTGRIVHAGEELTVRWEPDGGPVKPGMSSIPGLGQLFVVGDDRHARAVQTALFLGASCSWDAAVDNQGRNDHRCSPF